MEFFVLISKETIRKRLPVKQFLSEECWRFEISFFFFRCVVRSSWSRIYSFVSHRFLYKVSSWWRTWSSRSESWECSFSISLFDIIYHRVLITFWKSCSDNGYFDLSLIAFIKGHSPNDHRFRICNFLNDSWCVLDLHRRQVVSSRHSKNDIFCSFETRLE